MKASTAVTRALFFNGASSVVQPAQPEQLNETFTELQNMLAEWVELRIELNITVPTKTTDEIGNPGWSNSAIELILSVRSAPIFNKEAPRLTKVRAASQWTQLLTRALPFPLPEFPDTLPIGTGNQRGTKSRTYYPEASDETQTELDRGGTV